MLDLQEDSPLEMLRQFSDYLDGNLTENLGATKMIIDSKKGKGYISLYELVPGLTAWIYNIRLTSDLVIDAKPSPDSIYYFGYNITGSQLQKYPEEKEHHEIAKGQNFIIVSEPNLRSEYVVPKGIQFKCCYIIINPKILRENNIESKTRLLEDLKETLDVDLGKKPYRYFGAIDARIGTYASVIVDNERTDLVGRLITEGSVLRMLASQIEAHDHDAGTDAFHPILNKSEISRIAGVGDYILENLARKVSIVELGKHVRLSPKKIQAGIRFLYGYSANEYMNKLRLEHSRELMHATDMSISEICYAVGYQSRSYFSKIFLEMYGSLPNAYKKKYHSNNLLFDITYRSMATDALTLTDVDNLIEKARIENRKSNITGSLIYHRNIFFHIIEGTKKNVLALYDIILKDNRHHDVQIMWKGYKIRREFKDWPLAVTSDAGKLNVKIQGDTKNLDLSSLLGAVERDAITSQNLWKKVRDNIKLAAKISAA